MMTKTAYYMQMAQEAAAQITGSKEQWTAFLTTSARLYKYPFAEQLMIYKQRPEATACAEYDLWNDRMNRYVKRGSKGTKISKVPRATILPVTFPATVTFSPKIFASITPLGPIKTSFSETIMPLKWPSIRDAPLVCKLPHRIEFLPSKNSNSSKGKVLTATTSFLFFPNIVF